MTLHKFYCNAFHTKNFKKKLFDMQSMICWDVHLQPLHGRPENAYTHILNIGAFKRIPKGTYFRDRTHQTRDARQTQPYHSISLTNKSNSKKWNRFVSVLFYQNEWAFELCWRTERTKRNVVLAVISGQLKTKVVCTIYVC